MEQHEIIAEIETLTASLPRDTRYRLGVLVGKLVADHFDARMWLKSLASELWLTGATAQLATPRSTSAGWQLETRDGAIIAQVRNSMIYLLPASVAVMERPLTCPPKAAASAIAACWRGAT